MSGLNFKKYLEEAELRIDEEEIANFDTAVKNTLDEAKHEARSSSEAIVREELVKLEAIRSEVQAAEAKLKQRLSAIEDAEHQSTEVVAAAATSERKTIQQDAETVRQEIGKLKATRVMAELVWNELPKKIFIGLAVLVGLVIGSWLTVVAAASKRNSINQEIEVAQARLENLQTHLQYWYEAYGVEPTLYYGDPVFRLAEGMKFHTYTALYGPDRAGNLWHVVPGE